MKTVFISTSNRTIPILEELNRISDVVLCITKVDVKVGRKLALKKNEIKTWAKINDKKCLQVENLRGDNLENICQELRKLQPNLGIVIDCGFILPKRLIETFKGNLINIHFSLLPKYRGASPVQSVIINGDKKTGITFQFITEKLDEGDVLEQIEYDINDTETSGELYEKLFELTKENLGDFVKKYEEGKIVVRKQNAQLASYTYSPTQPTKTTIFKEDAYTDCKELYDNPINFDRKVRAYNPWPIVWTYVRDMETAGFKFRRNVGRQLKVKMYETLYDEKTNTTKITRIQIEGSKIMTWKEFVNGYLAL